MNAFIVRRLLSVVPVLFLVSLVVFGLTLLIPGDVAQTIAGGENARPERVEEIRSELGLDDPFLVQYGHWVADAVRLDFGESLLTGRPVTDEIRSKLPLTLSLALGALFFGLVVGVPAGIIAGMWPGSKTDRSVILGTTLGIAMPNFWLAMILATVFGVYLGWFPAVGFTRLMDSPLAWLRSIVLPSIALGAFVAATVTRQLRGEIADVLRKPYIRSAWAKGIPASRVVGKHALKNALIPTITVVGFQVGGLIGGTVIVEQIFAIPGLGTYLLTAITSSDIPVIMGVTTMFVLIYITCGVLVDIAYSLVNPKVRVT